MRNITEMDFHIDKRKGCPLGHKCIAPATPLFFKFGTWRQYGFTASFSSCHINACTFLFNTSAADALIFHSRDLGNSRLWIGRRKARPDQRWIYYSQESPRNVANYGYDLFEDAGWRLLFNWTATYRRDADFFVPYGLLQKRKVLAMDSVTFPRKRLAYAVISNCRFDSGRLNFLKQLAHHMDVSIFGRCGHPFPYPNFASASKDFYFYMAFENSRCKDYISEKFWTNGLRSGAVPVVIGARREDYFHLAPPNSYVFADDFSSPKSLAVFLKTVASNATLYRRYFEWRKQYVISSDITNNLKCHLCRKLHEKNNAVNKVDLRVAWTLSDCYK